VAKITERDRKFAAYLEELRDRHDGRAAMAALRRSVGKIPGDAPEADRYILRWLPAQPSAWQLREERGYYLAAALFAWHQLPWHPPEGEKSLTNFGASMRVLASQVQSGGPERRIVAMLTCSLAELPEHLRRSVELLKSKSIKIDWAQLLADIRHWEDEDRRVQSEWARAFWGETSPESAAKEEPGTAAPSEKQQ